MHTNAAFSSSSPWDMDSGKLELSLEICPFNSAPHFWSRQFQEKSLRNNKRIVSFIKTKHKTAEDDTASKSSGGREDTKRPCLCPKCYLLEDSHCPHHPWSTLEGSGTLFPMPWDKWDLWKRPLLHTERKKRIHKNPSCLQVQEPTIPNFLPKKTLFNL